MIICGVLKKRVLDNHAYKPSANYIVIRSIKSGDFKTIGWSLMGQYEKMKIDRVQHKLFTKLNFFLRLVNVAYSNSINCSKLPSVENEVTKIFGIFAKGYRRQNENFVHLKLKI